MGFNSGFKGLNQMWVSEQTPVISLYRTNLQFFITEMGKKTKLRIHNITAKAALKSGSKAWVLKEREVQRLEAAQMKFLDTYFE